jgi:hypothetical protein
MRTLTIFTLLTLMSVPAFAQEKIAQSEWVIVPPSTAKTVKAVTDPALKAWMTENTKAIGGGSIAVKKDPEWLPFEGKATLKGEMYTIVTKNGYTLEAPKAEVQVSGGFIGLKNNGAAKLVSSPKAIEKDAKAMSCVIQNDCPSKCCACIPTFIICVRVCCGSGGTRGVSAGLWSCPG